MCLSFFLLVIGTRKAREVNRTTNEKKEKEMEMEMEEVVMAMAEEKEEEEMEMEEVVVELPNSPFFAKFNDSTFIFDVFIFMT